MSQDNRTFFSVFLVIVASVTLFCISTFIFPIEKPVPTPRPTVDAKGVEFEDHFLRSDDFSADNIKLGNQHEGLPSKEFLSELQYGFHTFKDYGNPIRIYTYEFVSNGGYNDSEPEGYLVVFIYETAGEAKKVYGSGREIGGFDLAYFQEDQDGWASGRFLRCRMIGDIHIDRVYDEDVLNYLSKGISLRMEYLC